MSGPGLSGEAGCALVVGAAGGIGAAVAGLLAAQGRQLALLDRDGDGLDTARARCAGPDRRVTAHPADVTRRDEIEHAVEQIEKAHGRIDELVYAAGVLHTGGLGELAETGARDMIEVNFAGVVHTLTAVGARMRERGRGAIVVVGSNAGGVPRMRMGVYGATKAAAESFTHATALELGPYGIRANVVAPGSTDTPMLRALYANEVEMLAHTVHGSPADFRIGIPLRRIADAADIADAVGFLLSDRARHITMQTLYVDGGAALHA